MNKGFNWLKNVFTLDKPAQYRPAGNTPEFYQVKPTDKDLASVASQFNVQLPSLVAANNGSKTLPPVGSYISMGQQQAAEQFARKNFETGSFMTPDKLAQYRLQGTLGNYQAETSANIQKQVAAGIFPQQVMSNTPILNPQTGKPVSDAEMLQNGYVYDNKTASWYLGGQTPAMTTTGAPQSAQDAAAALKQYQLEVAVARSRKRRYKMRHAATAEAATPEAANAGDTANTVLNFTLGSG